jgi:hypothetical protein
MVEHKLPTFGADTPSDGFLIAQTTAADVAILSRTGLLFLDKPLCGQIDAALLTYLAGLTRFFRSPASPLMQFRLGAENGRANYVFGIPVWIVEGPVGQDADLQKRLAIVPHSFPFTHVALLMAAQNEKRRPVTGGAIGLCRDDTLEGRVAFAARDPGDRLTVTDALDDLLKSKGAVVERIARLPRVDDCCPRH